jgi:UDP:flavonoid glycosyltransferase YjiC (YdhE family)
MRIVFATFGTFGDVNPLIGIGSELCQRGHTVVLAAPEMFRQQAYAGGLAFAPLRPDQDPTDSAMIAMVYDRKRGTERGLREFLFPALRDSYHDLLAVVQADGGADLLVSSELAYAAPLVAEFTGIPWASYVLAPFSFFSGYDPPVLPPYPILSQMLANVPGTGHLLRPFARVITRSWCKPVFALRRELGLSRGESPLFDAKHAPGLVLALFSPLLGAPQADWPANTEQCGFVFYDRDSEHSTLSPELEAFLQAGPPPLVFTLGSAAVLDPGDFWKQSTEAARLLGMRAVLLTGKHIATQPDSHNICRVGYAPYSLLFPRAAAIIHQGGVGTTAQALRAGKPMLVMPYSHDQPDNARRMQRLGVAKVLLRERYTGARAATRLRTLLRDESYTREALVAKARMEKEDGLHSACDALEAAATRGAQR